VQVIHVKASSGAAAFALSSAPHQGQHVISDWPHACRKRLPESSPLACNGTVRHDMRPCRGSQHRYRHVHVSPGNTTLAAKSNQYDTSHHGPEIGDGTWQIPMSPPPSSLRSPVSSLQPPPSSLPHGHSPTDPPPPLPLFVLPVALGVGAVPSPRHVPLMRLSTAASLLQLDAAVQNKPSPVPAPCITEPLKPCASCEHDASG
jgi:hypothetical protein